MANTSLSAAKAGLYSLLTTPALPDGVTAAYDYEPLPGHAQKPVALTVYTAGMTSVDYLIGVRIYVTAEVDAQKAAQTIDTLIHAVDARMTSQFGPSNWTVTFFPDLGALVAEQLFEIGREDDTAWR